LAFYLRAMGLAFFPGRLVALDWAAAKAENG